ncbi:MAG: MmcQ/YjbR family DNA-binding protein [Chthoniobacterales bacterium]
MTPAQFRRLALSFPGVIESSHMSHPDFRVGGKIFATLGYPDKNYGVVVVAPAEQARLLRDHPKAFLAAKGQWGKRGCTAVLLAAVDQTTMKSALKSAWQDKAPKKLAK